MNGFLLGLVVFLIILAILVSIPKTFRIYLKMLAYPQIRPGKQFQVGDMIYTVKEIYTNLNNTRMVAFTFHDPHSRIFNKPEMRYSSMEYFAAAFVIKDADWASEILRRDEW